MLGLDRIVHKRDPGLRQDNNSYTHPPIGLVKTLPGNLLDALRCLKSSEVLAHSLGETFVTTYLNLKHQEWQRSNTSITPWELANTLDC
jgi:glutamate---methylamine ligase